MIESKHINSAFDAELENINTMLMKMGGMVEQAVQQSTRALLDRDAALSAEVIADDRKIDELDEQINDAAVSIIALRQPQAQDLRTVIAAMKIASSLERSGDLAKNIAKRTTAILEARALGEGAGSVRRLARSVSHLMSDALNVFIRRDAVQAGEVILSDNEVDQMYNALFREVLTHMMEDPRSITEAMHYLFIAKNLERVGDHATSIAEQVIYIVTGALPSDERPKDDSVSYGDAES